MVTTNCQIFTVSDKYGIGKINPGFHEQTLFNRDVEIYMISLTMHTGVFSRDLMFIRHDFDILTFQIISVQTFSCLIVSADDMMGATQAEEVFIITIPLPSRGNSWGTPALFMCLNFSTSFHDLNVFIKGIL